MARTLDVKPDASVGQLVGLGVHRKRWKHAPVGRDDLGRYCSDTIEILFISGNQARARCWHLRGRQSRRGHSVSHLLCSTPTAHA